MLLKLSLLLSTIGFIACNVPFDTTKEVKYEETNQIQQRNYQHSEYLNSYTEVVYKYESNEVNSVDDIVEGNIYYMDLSLLDYTIVLSQDEYFEFEVLYSQDGINLNYGSSENVFLDDYYYAPGTFIHLERDNSFVYYNSQILNEFDLTLIDFNGYCVIWLNSVSTEHYLNGLLTYTDYNLIESVIYHQPQTVIGVINEFCETYLFSEIPYINSMTFEVGGQSINLMTYLIIIVGICLAIGLLILFIWLLKFIFGLFAGVFRMRR